MRALGTDLLLSRFHSKELLEMDQQFKVQGHTSSVRNGGNHEPAEIFTRVLQLRHLCEYHFTILCLYFDQIISLC